MKKDRNYKIIIFILLLISSLFFIKNISPFLISGITYIQDMTLIIEHEVARESILRGQYPGWDPYHSRPILLNPKSQIFYPPALILNLVFGPEQMIRILFILHILFSFFVLYKFTKFIINDKFIAISISILYILIGNLPANIYAGNFEYVFSYLILPFALLSFYFWFKKQNNKNFISCIIALSFILLAGNIFLFLLLLISFLILSKFYLNKIQNGIPLYATLLSSIKLFPLLTSNTLFINRLFTIFSTYNFYIIPILIILLFFFKYHKQKIIKLAIPMCLLYAISISFFFIPHSFNVEIKPPLIIESKCCKLDLIYTSPNFLRGIIETNVSINVSTLDLVALKIRMAPFGWRAYLDDKLIYSYAWDEGEGQPFYTRLNITAGKHIFELTYKSLSSFFGLQISLITIILLLLFFYNPRFLDENKYKIFLFVILALQIQLIVRMLEEERIQPLAPEEINLLNKVQAKTNRSIFLPGGALAPLGREGYFYYLLPYLMYSLNLIDYFFIIPYIFYLLSTFIVFLLIYKFFNKNMLYITLPLYVSNRILVHALRIVIPEHMMHFFILCVFYFMFTFFSKKQKIYALILGAISAGFGTMLHMSFLFMLFPALIACLFIFKRKIKLRHIFIFISLYLLVISPFIYVTGKNTITDLIRRYFEETMYKEKEGIMLLRPLNYIPIYFRSLIPPKFLFLYSLIYAFFFALLLIFYRKSNASVILFTTLICIFFISGAYSYGVFVSSLWILSFCILIYNIFNFVIEKFNPFLKGVKKLFKILKHISFNLLNKLHFFTSSFTYFKIEKLKFPKSLHLTKMINIKTYTPYLYSILLFLILIFLIISIYPQREFLESDIKKYAAQINESNTISKNPDFNYTRNEWPNRWGASSDELPQSFWDPWKGEFAYFTEIANRKGVMLIHPGKETPRFIEQDVSLPKGKIFLFATIADIANDYNKFFNKTNQCLIADVLFEIKIISGDKENVIFTKVVDSEEKWVDVVLDISKFSGKNVTMRIESHGGGYDPWCGEFAAVDKFYVVKVA